MKKLRFLWLLPVISCIFLFGCENSNKIYVASFSEITAAGSTDYGVKISFADDKRVEEKYYDVQLMSDENDVGMTIFLEGDEKFSATISERGRWQSLTSLKVNAAGLEGRETFSQLKDAINQNYIFSVNKKCKLIFRVVAGEMVKNSNGVGQVLANTNAVSKDFVIDCKAS